MSLLGLARLGQTVAVNAVLIYFLVTGRWSAATVLALYWFENLVSAVLIAIRVLVHQLITKKIGHYVSASIDRKPISMFRSTVLFGILFTIGQGIFIGVIVGALDETGRAFDRAEFINGAKAIVAILILGFVIDMATIGRQPFAWIKLITNLMNLRVVVMQIVAVVGAILCFAFTPIAAVAVFVVMKVVVDVFTSQLRPDAISRLTDPSEELSRKMSS